MSDGDSPIPAAWGGTSDDVSIDEPTPKSFFPALISVIKFYPTLFLNGFMVAIPAFIYIFYTLISRVSMFCEPSDRTRNDLFFLTIDNVIQNVSVLIYPFLPWYILFREQLKKFRVHTLTFAIIICLWSAFKPYTFANLLPAGLLLVVLYVLFSFHIFHFAHFVSKRNIISKSCFFRLYLPFLFYILFMEFLILPAYFSDDDDITSRLVIRVIIAPMFSGMMLYSARLALNNVKTSPHDRVFLITYQNACKLLVLRLLITNAGSFWETSVMLLLAGLGDVFWRFTVRYRDIVLAQISSALVPRNECRTNSSNVYSESVCSSGSFSSTNQKFRSKLSDSFPAVDSVPNLVSEDSSGSKREWQISCSSLFPELQHVELSKFDGSFDSDQNSNHVDGPRFNLSNSSNDSSLTTSQTLSFLPLKRKGTGIVPLNKTKAEDGGPLITDVDECYYIHLFMTECVLDIGSILITSLMKICSFILFDTVTPIRNLLLIALLQLCSAAIPDMLILYLISRHRFQQGIDPIFSVLWKHYRHSKHYFLISLAMINATLFFTIRFYLSLRGAWHNFGRDSVPPSWTDRCNHVPFGPFDLS
ncbi:hypothetical protein P9112_007755 [Eukaryota sp. TZLM1-RC]